MLGRRDRHAGAVTVDSAGVRSRNVTNDEYGLTEAHRRFGGLDLPAVLAGMLCALGTTVLLAGIIGAVSSIGYERGDEIDEISWWALIAGMAVLLVSFTVGGWVAGRMARYDGARNGLATAVAFIVLTAGFSALGAWADDRYDFFSDIRLPDWFSEWTAASILSAVAGIVVMLVAGAIGGTWGARYHRRVDRFIAHNRSGGLVTGDATSDLERSVPRQPAPASRDEVP